MLLQFFFIFKNMANRKFRNQIFGYFFIAVGIFIFSGFISAIPISKTNTAAMPDTALLKLSGDFLYQVKIQTPTTVLETELA